MSLEVKQQSLRLGRFERGVHLVTGNVLRGLTIASGCRAGLLHVQLLHTSCSLALNENASPDVRMDLEAFLDQLVPDDTGYFSHTAEGRDDMPAHVKSVVTGSSLILPLSNGHPVLGTWQGIYLCEHRDAGGERRLHATVIGDFS